MAKKKRAEAKNIFNKYLKEFLSFLLSLLEEGTGDLIRKFGDIMNFKKRLRKYIIFLILITASITIFLIGIAELIESFYPNLRPGTTHILLSVVVILIVLIYKKFY